MQDGDIIMNDFDVFCGINSVGMPFTIDNKYHIGYYDIIIDKLKDKGYSVSGFNLSILNKNHTWDLENNLNQNKSLAYIKNLQLKSIDELRNANILFKLIIPKKFKKSFKVHESDKYDTLKEIYINAKNPIFIYSAGPNDFFSYIKAGPVELIDKKKRDSLPIDLQPLLEKCINNIENNWILLYKLNPNIKIYALSFYYSPLFDIIQKIIYIQEKSKNKPYINGFMAIITKYNQMLFEASQKYDYVEYCDITFLKNYCAPMDFHPNTMGNRLIAEEIVKKIEAILPIKK